MTTLKLHASADPYTTRIAWAHEPTSCDTCGVTIEPAENTVLQLIFDCDREEGADALLRSRWTDDGTAVWVNCEACALHDLLATL